MNYYYLYLIIATIVGIIVGWKYRKKSYLIMILGFVFCPIIILFSIAVLFFKIVKKVKKI